MDSEYIKMVLALPDEFFEEWEWEAGDQVLHKLEYSDEWKTEFILDNGIAYTISLNKGNVWGKYIPLPSQEQLQEKILDYWKKNIYSGYTYVELISQFRIFIFQRCDIKKLRDNKSTVNEMWLMFLEDEIYHKMWNGDAWI